MDAYKRVTVSLPVELVEMVDFLSAFTNTSRGEFIAWMFQEGIASRDLWRFYLLLRDGHIDEEAFTLATKMGRV